MNDSGTATIFSHHRLPARQPRFARVTSTGTTASSRTAMECAVDRAVEAMSEDLCCDDGIAGIAADTFYSKFHFAREFSRITGTTARRFLAALRMQRAKAMILETDFGIADVSAMVGYVSVGTFSSRFAALVGMSPRQWRMSCGQVSALTRSPGTERGVLTGIVELPWDCAQVPCDVFVGAFPDSVVQGEPVACTRLSGGGAFELTGVPPGTWVVSVVAQAYHVDDDNTVRAVELRGRNVMTAFDDPATTQVASRFRLAPRRASDPPVVRGGVTMPTATQADSETPLLIPRKVARQNRYR